MHRPPPGFACGAPAGWLAEKTREEFAHDFNRFGIGSCFQTVVCAEDTAEHKPNPAPLLKYMELSGAASDSNAGGFI
ncbi:HAD hydrolase-like protein [Lachnospiraceae bacterium 45-P1]